MLRQHGKQEDFEMCTNISLKTSKKDYLFARTMDFSYELEPEFVVFPRNYPLPFLPQDTNGQEHHAFMGLSKNISVYQMADGINEHGLAAAALYFEGYAHYQSEITPGMTGVAPEELVQLVLATCKTIEEIKALFENYCIVSRKLDFLGIVPPLHWAFHDVKGNSVVLEVTKSGVYFYEHDLGVLANSPGYEWHVTNARNYISLDPVERQIKSAGKSRIKIMGKLRFFYLNDLKSLYYTIKSQIIIM